MRNFNEMIELNIGLLVFAILVTFFILLGCVGYKRRNRSYVRRFVWIVCMNLVMLIGECGLWIMKLGIFIPHFIKSGFLVIPNQQPPTRQLFCLHQKCLLRASRTPSRSQSLNISSICIIQFSLSTSFVWKQLFAIRLTKPRLTSSFG